MPERHTRRSRLNSSAHAGAASVCHGRRGPCGPSIRPGRRIPHFVTSSLAATRAAHGLLLSALRAPAKLFEHLLHPELVSVNGRYCALVKKTHSRKRVLRHRTYACPRRLLSTCRTLKTPDPLLRFSALPSSLSPSPLPPSPPLKKRPSGSPRSRPRWLSAGPQTPATTSSTRSASASLTARRRGRPPRPRPSSLSVRARGRLPLGVPEEAEAPPGAREVVRHDRGQERQQ